MKKLISSGFWILLLVWINGCATAPVQKQFMQKIEKQVVITTQYLVYLPENYYKTPDEKWPLLIFLHGAGERGTDIEKVKANGIPKLIEAGRKFPWIVVSPQCPEGRWWEIEDLMDMLRTVERDYRVDPDRIFLTGLSMGGGATWRWAERYPELFAALVPVCGDGDPANVYRYRHIPIWVFQGAKDESVRPEKVQAMVDALKQCQADVTFTLYPDVGHASWEPAYAEEKLYTWLADKRRKPIEIPMVKTYAPLEAIAAPSEIKVDGELSEWSRAKGLRLETADRSQGMRRIKLKWPSDKKAECIYRGPQDCSALIKMMWSKEGLYLAAEVVDDQLVCERTGDPIWIGDCVDLGLSFREESDSRRPYVQPVDLNQGGWETFTDKDFIFGFAPSGPHQTPEYHIYRNPRLQNQRPAEGIQVASKITLTGYVLEAFIPASLLKCQNQLKPGAQWRFNCGVYDLDKQAKPEDFAVSEWPSSGGDPWSPDTFGTMILEE